jgi:hypothetical protein
LHDVLITANLHNWLLEFLSQSVTFI